MKPLSWRLEKLIFCIWHLFAVIVIYNNFYDHTLFNPSIYGSTMEFGELTLQLAIFFYMFWQGALLLLHGFNALFGAELYPFNVGSWKQFFKQQLHLALNSPLRVDSPSDYSNINRVIQFREAKMGAMSQQEAAELLTDTAILDQLHGKGVSQYGSNHKRAADFLESKLGAMSQSDGLEFVKRK